MMTRSKTREVHNGKDDRNVSEVEAHRNENLPNQVIPRRRKNEKHIQSRRKNIEMNSPEIASNVQLLQGEDMLLLSSQEQDTVGVKRRKLETNPLKLEHILEKVISFLDASSLKQVRQVNKLWSQEGGKMLITKSFLRIPLKIWSKDSAIKSKEIEEFKAFLSFKNNENSMIPKIIVEAPRDFKLWKTLGILGPQVNSLKINIIDDNAKTLSNLLDLLPNLKTLDFQGMECATFCNKKDPIFKALSSALSKRERDGNPLIISLLNVHIVTVNDVEINQTFSNCRNIKLQTLNFAVWADLVKNLPHTGPKITNNMTNILSASQETLKHLVTYFSEICLSLIEFPRMTALTNMDLRFTPQGPSHLLNYGFAPSFRFSEKVPNLNEIGIYYNKLEGVPVADEFLKNIFETTGQAPSVKRVKYSDSYLGFDIDHLLQTFPNVEDFQAVKTGCSREMFQSLWKYGKIIQRLYFNVNLDEFLETVADLDSIFTGFDPATTEMMRNSPEPAAYTLKELERLRVNPSILNLKELKIVRIQFHGTSKTDLPERMLAIAGKFAFRFLPADCGIIISVRCCKPSPQGALAALEEVSKLPNVFVF